LGARDKIKHLRREQLLEATIETIASRGFSRTTLGHIAKKVGLSQGIVNFYFKSKDALLLETLNFLAEEYETVWRRAVAATGSDAVAALNAIIETDLGPEVCNRKKVAVWVAFWSEAQCQPQYRRLCSQLSDDYFDQVREIVAQLIEQGQYEHYDADAIARGLNSMVNGLWLELMVDPKHFDRDAAKRACQTYLASVFPTEFGGFEKESVPVVAGAAS
jgi:TetR/AcrR family transcriptional repressor of bet genes